MERTESAARRESSTRADSRAVAARR